MQPVSMWRVFFRHKKILLYPFVYISIVPLAAVLITYAEPTGQILSSWEQFSLLADIILFWMLFIVWSTISLPFVWGGTIGLVRDAYHIEAGDMDHESSTWKRFWLHGKEFYFHSSQFPLFILFSVILSIIYGKGFFHIYYLSLLFAFYLFVFFFFLILRSCVVVEHKMAFSASLKQSFRFFVYALWRVVLINIFLTPFFLFVILRYALLMMIGGGWGYIILGSGIDTANTTSPFYSRRSPCL